MLIGLRRFAELLGDLALGIAEDRLYTDQYLIARGRLRIAQGRLREGLRQVRAAVGAGGVSTVVEVAPWSRIPEARALLVPRDD